MEDEQPISFVGTTASGATSEHVHEFEEPSVITRAKVVTHRGQQYALQQDATLIRDGSRTGLWESVDRDFIAGNGQVFDLPMRFEVTRGDKLVLEAENVNQDGNEYHHNMHVTVDREGIVSRLSDRLRRVI